MFNHFNIPETWGHFWTKYPEGYTMLEAITDWVNQTDAFIDKLNSVDADISSRVKDSDITINRKLSQKGDFTGSLSGRSLPRVFADIAESLTLSKAIRDLVNSRESIGTIYDGGTFDIVLPPIFSIEGGLF